MTDDNGLLQLIRDQRRRGTSYLDIERLFSIPAARAEQIMSDYFARQESARNQDEMRILQMERLEAILGPMMDRIEVGDVKAAEVLIKAVSSLNELLGLNLEQKKIEITLITEQQGDAVYRLVDAVIRSMLGLVQEVITDQAVLGEIEERWDQRALEAFSTAKKREDVVDAEVLAS